MKRSEFAIARFENRNGVISWRVTGWLHGERVRRNFKTREEAAAEKATLEIQAEELPEAGARAAGRDAVAEYVAQKERERDQHALTACQVGSIAKELR